MITLSDRDIELVQRQRKTVARRFDIGFLPGPASEKSGLQFIPFKTPHGLTLVFREKTLRQTCRLDFSAHVFHVHPDFPLLHKCHKCQTVCMGDVKRQTALALESRLAIARIAETYFLRSTSEVLSQQRTQRSAGQDKFVAWPFDTESSRPFLLFDREPFVTRA